jgi:ADP-ribose pyrophosphatase YjhB (NUDIX family)
MVNIIMSEKQIHKAQVSILHSLRYANTKRFSELMRPTGHMSDTFKFHLRKLISLGYVEKLSSGEYQLTTTGKEFATILDEINRMPKKQPKLSVFVLVYKKLNNGKIKFLLHKRARNPFLGYWTGITDTVRWGETFDDAAARVLHKQTGLEASFALKTFKRVRDYDSESRELLEDKLFVIMLATNVKGDLQNSYPGGTNAWLTLEELMLQDKYFSTMPPIMEDALSGKSFTTHDLWHNPKEY